MTRKWMVVVVVVVVRLHKKSEGCGASIASAAGSFSTRNLNHGIGFYGVAFPSNASSCFLL
jgi:hypothetical protein